MKTFFLIGIICLISLEISASGVIRINQLGYLPNSVKVTVYLSDQNEDFTSFQLFETLSGKLVFEGKAEPADVAVWGQKSAFRLNFSSFSKPGGYYLKAGYEELPFIGNHNERNQRF